MTTTTDFYHCLVFSPAAVNANPQAADMRCAARASPPPGDLWVPRSRTNASPKIRAPVDSDSVDMAGVTTTEQTITQDGRAVKLYIMKPEHVSGKPGVLLFIHGGVWIVGNFQNHQRLLRDLVVGSGQVGVFVEYTPLPAAKFPTQLEESYAALKWVAGHAGEFGADGSRIAVAGNSDVRFGP